MRYPRITIAGVGIVGNAIRSFFETRGVTSRVYDPPLGYHDESALCEADLVFIAVPTPYGETGFDRSHLDAVLPLIGRNATVVIKSTLLPGTTDRYQQQYPQLKILFSPEFLSSSTAVSDFARPTRQLVGYTEQSKLVAQSVLELLPDAPYKKIMRAIEAEMVKYMNNVFYALKVTYANQIYDLCEAVGVDYTAVAEAAVTHEPWMGQNHWDVFHGGYRGYGGACLPKDIRSIIQLGKTMGIDVRLLELVEELNNIRTKQQ